MLPIIYYETTVIYLDDNKKFLTLLKNSDISKINIFSTNAEIVEKCIKKEKSNIAVTSEIDIGETQERFIKYNLTNLKNRLNDSKKENEISVMVVDYDMLTIDGLSFCKQINKINPNIYKIFLTGAAEKDEVIEAMQERLIDFYISKSDKNLIDKLKGAVSRGKKEYFKRICKNLYNILLNKDIYKSYIDNIKYIEFMERQMSRESVEEYCLIEDIGSYLIKEQNKEIVIILADEEKQKGVVEYLKDMIDEKLEQEILEGSKIFDHYSLGKAKLSGYKSVMYDQYIYPYTKIIESEKLYIVIKEIKSI